MHCSVNSTLAYDPVTLPTAHSLLLQHPRYTHPHLLLHRLHLRYDLQDLHHFKFRFILNRQLGYLAYLASPFAYIITGGTDGFNRSLSSRGQSFEEL